MSIPRPAEITPERVRRFAATLGGIGFAAGYGFGALNFGGWSTLRFSAIGAFTVACLLYGANALRRWPPTRSEP